ncbi:hypothetical protein ABTZ58_23740 [Streptomyces sp. NPDC094143]|uniref:DUF6924 domain-containing protein n=1 Tax=Streptomyces sp. NPDC094143 TaxID=3155310 RepID=UPI00331DCA47
MLTPLTGGTNPLLIRTHYSDERAWERFQETLRDLVAQGLPVEVRIVDDPAYRDFTPERLMSVVLETDDDGDAFLFVADGAALEGEHPVLVLGLRDEDRGRAFRVVASELPGVESNLSLGNMDFEEFADGTDEDGVFRGF